MTQNVGRDMKPKDLRHWLFETVMRIDYIETTKRRGCNLTMNSPLRFAYQLIDALINFSY